jgi:two-component system chemotaxis response regulator CheB
VIAIAASTGGPPALYRLLSDLPGDFAAPILVVQHIASGFTPGLATWLNAASDLNVRVARHGEALAGRQVYLAPDDHHLGVATRTSVVVSREAPIGGFRPSGNFLFDSVGRVFGSSSIAVILTGMGDDGVEGLRTIRQARGRIIAQDESSSVIFGMPGAAVAAGLADTVLPLDALASHLVQLVERKG